jgi:putative hemolysin
MEVEQSQDSSKLIDVERVLQLKNPRLARLMPGFIISYLKRIIHQDEVNAFIAKSKHRFGLDFVDAIIDEFRANVEIVGLQYIPPKDRVIVASNHPLGGPDGIALMQAVGKVRADILFPVNDILLHLENLKPLFIPINKHGSNTENIRILNETFAGDSLICYFPFGLVSRKRKGVIADLEWKKTFLSKAKRYKRDIIPTHISGRNSNFFYRLANFRKAVGIKANFEMLYLADEFYKQNDRTIRITFGKAVPYTVFNSKHTDAQWAEQLRRYIYQLGRNKDEEFYPDRDYPKI